MTNLPTTDHLVALPGTANWAMWTWGALRSAGFPASTVLALAHSEAATAADEANQARVELSQEIAESLRRLGERFDAFCAHSPGHRLTRRGSGPLQALKALRAGRVPPEFEGERELDLSLAKVRRRAEGESAARTRFVEAYNAAVAATSATVVDLARDPRVGEAGLWQNRHAYHTGVRRLAARGTDTARNSDRRQHEQLMARMIQRYATKNDTIGFFGPVGWIQLGQPGRPLTAEHGPRLIRDRNIHLEQWTVDTLANVIASEPGMEQWLRPRTLPDYRLEGDQLISLLGPPQTLLPLEVAVLHACTGRRPARGVAADLLARPELGVTAEEQVYAVLRDLLGRGLIVWRLDVPFTTDADVALAGFLETVDEPSLREPALAKLRELQAAKAAVVAAAGTVDELDRALQHLESTFERITGAAATRAHGQTYAGRTPVYEDCQRDIDVRLGPKLMTELSASLEPLLRSARWICGTTAQRHRDLFEPIYDELAARIGPRIPLAALWLRLPEVFPVMGTTYRGRNHAAEVLIAEMKSEVSRRWLEVLELDDLSPRRVHRSLAEVRRRAETAFPEISPGWRMGHVHCPDVMIAATSVEAVNRGDYRLVLGEIHLSVNTLAAALFVDSHPDRFDLGRCAKADLGMQHVSMLGPRNWNGNISRFRQALPEPKTTYLLVSPEPAPHSADPEHPRPAQISFVELVVERIDGKIMISTMDGRFRCEFIEIFGQLITYSILNTLRLFGSEPHTPRITLDRFVLQRESWRFPVDEVPADGATEAERFAGIRRWATERGLPRRVFYTAPVEDKPLFLDLHSPILIEVFAKVVRRTQQAADADARIVVSEMLPDIEHSWLVDANGERYTSELRLVAVDLIEDQLATLP